MNVKKLCAINLRKLRLRMQAVVTPAVCRGDAFVCFQGCALTGAGLQIIGMSATLPNVQLLADRTLSWLGQCLPVQQAAITTHFAGGLVGG